MSGKTTRLVRVAPPGGNPRGAKGTVRSVMLRPMRIGDSVGPAPSRAGAALQDALVGRPCIVAASTAATPE